MKVKDFSGEDLFIGLDVHKKSWQVSVHFLGVLMKSFRMDPDSKQLRNWLDRHYPGARYYSCYEAGFSGNWLHRDLAALGIENLVVHANDVPTTGKEKDRKSDPIDCRKLSRSLACGLLKANYVPTIEVEGDRQLLRCWSSTSKDVRRMKHRIKSQLLCVGRYIPKAWDNSYWSKELFNWLDEQDLDSAGGQLVFRHNMDRLRSRISEEKALKAAVVELSESEAYIKNYELLKSIPGFGLNISMNFLVELVSMTRFDNLDKLCSYVGLVPSSHSSGEKERIGELTGRTHKRLLPLLIQASWVAIRCSAKFRKYFYDQKKNKRENQAIIKVARKLLSVMRAVWQDQKPFSSTK